MSQPSAASVLQVLSRVKDVTTRVSRLPSAGRDRRGLPLPTCRPRQRARESPGLSAGWAKSVTLSGAIHTREVAGSITAAPITKGL